MKYAPLDTTLFLNNRKNFIANLKPGSLAFFNSNYEMIRNGDATFPFKQNSDIFYLTGIDQEDSILILFPDCPLPQYREALYIKKTSEHIKIWEGHKYTQEEAKSTSGISSIFWLEEFESHLHMLMNWSENIYLNLNENDRFASKASYKDHWFAHDLQRRYPLHVYHRSAPILARLRMIKSQIEIDTLREAINITEIAFRRLLHFVKPGVAEYEIEAEIIHEFIRSKASGHAFTPIIASGANACVLHYNDNNQICRDGDFLLLDFGAEYGNYCADLSRSIPVNGRFTQRQKDVYNAVLRVMKHAKSLLVPGNYIEKYHQEVGLFMEQELIGLGLLKADEVKNQNPERPLYKKYFMHGTSHHLGLDVHDLGNRHLPMTAGMVLTCEPGIYILEEGLGIRLENDILITPDGPVDLMETMPLEADEIESLMNA
jgi:Xaa-Pro aminopeptidase